MVTRGYPLGKHLGLPSIGQKWLQRVVFVPWVAPADPTALIQHRRQRLPVYPRCGEIRRCVAVKCAPLLKEAAFPKVLGKRNVLSAKAD